MSDTGHRKFPGHLAVGLALRVTPEEKVEVLIIGVLSKGAGVSEIKIKIPGGCADSEMENAEPGLALGRELASEVGGGDGFMICVGPQYFVRVKTPRGGGHVHYQYFYLVEVRGPLREVDRVEDEGDETLSPPMWVPIELLLPGGSMEIFFSHREPLIRGFAKFAHDRPHVAAQYAEVLADFDTGVFESWFNPQHFRQRRAA